MKYVLTVLLVLLTGCKSSELFKFGQVTNQSTEYYHMKHLYNQVMTGYEDTGDSIYGYCKANAIVNEKISEYNTLMIVYPKYCDATTDLPCEIHVAEDCNYKI